MLSLLRSTRILRIFLVHRWPLGDLLQYHRKRFDLDRNSIRVFVGKTNETQDNDLPLSNGDLRFGWHFRLEYHGKGCLRVGGIQGS